MFADLSFLKNIPLSFYLWSVILVLSGIRRCKVHIDHLYAIQLVTLVFMIICLLLSIKSGDISSRWVYLFISVLCGSTIGFYIFYPTIRAYDAQKKLVTFEGEWFTLCAYATVICLHLISVYMSPPEPVHYPSIQPYHIEEDAEWISATDDEEKYEEQYKLVLSRLEKHMELQKIEKERAYRSSWSYWIDLIGWGILSGLFLGRFLKLRSQLKKINNKPV